jgi:hypothetical protein
MGTTSEKGIRESRDFILCLEAKARDMLWKILTIVKYPYFGQLFTDTRSQGPPRSIDTCFRDKLFSKD